MHFKELSVPLIPRFYSGSGPSVLSPDGKILYSCSVSAKNIPSIHATNLQSQNIQELVSIEMEDEDVPIAMETANDLLFVSFRVSNSVSVYKYTSAQIDKNIVSSSSSLMDIDTFINNSSMSSSLTLIQNLRAHSDSPVIKIVAIKNYILTSSTDRSIRIWGLNPDDNLFLVNTLRTGNISTSIDLSLNYNCNTGDDNDVIITTSSTGQVRFWDLKTTKPISSVFNSIDLDGESISATTILTEFSIITVALGSGIIFLWDIKKQSIVKRITFDEVTEITSIASVGRLLWIGSSDSIRAYAFSIDFTFKLINKFPFGCHRLLIPSEHQNQIVLLGASSLPLVQVISISDTINSTNFLAKGGTNIDTQEILTTKSKTIGDPGEITDAVVDSSTGFVIFATAFGTLVATKGISTEDNFFEWPTTSQPITNSPIMVLSKVSNKSLFVSGSKDGLLVLWSISTCRKMQAIAYVSDAHGSNATITGVALGENKIWSIGADGLIRQWSINEKKSHHSISGPVGGSGNNLDLYSSKLEILLESSITGHGAESVLSLDYNLRNSQLITGSQDKNARIWDIRDNGLCPSLRHTLSGHTRSVWSVSFSSKQLAVTGSADMTIRIWNTFTGTLLSVLGGPGSDGTHTGSVLRVNFYSFETKEEKDHQQDLMVVSTGSDGLVKLWNWCNRSCITTLEPKGTSTQKLWSLVVCPDGSIISGNGIVFKDFSMQIDAMEHASKVESMVVEQALVNAIALGQNREAVRLAIIHNQPFRFFSILKTFILTRHGCDSTRDKLESDSINSDHDDLFGSVVEVIEKDPKSLSLLSGWISKWITRPSDAPLCHYILTGILNNCSSSGVQMIVKDFINMLPYSERLYERMDDALSSFGAIDALLHTIGSDII